MKTATWVLLIAAFVLFVVAALGVSVLQHVNLQAAGLACWVLSALLGRIPRPPAA